LTGRARSTPEQAGGRLSCHTGIGSGILPRPPHVVRAGQADTPTQLAKRLRDGLITVARRLRGAIVHPRRSAGLRRHLDTTPSAYLRRARLDRAHQQLCAASPGDGVTVTEIATRWGFASPSRFTASYRDTCGVLPSHTLRS